ncbi:serine/threonine-protein kinase [Verrucomicrobium spinosum]|uniref:serine/threonine-protein kinase n=1 Tax=Verrucomicrobium spinosum TaxID=2736 RepID=UPI00017453D2|nr:serine/threonine-protein kinase [Verrucomicrobium spinosum]
MNFTTCPECGAAFNKAGSTLCPACLFSLGAVTQVLRPVQAGLLQLPCEMGGYHLVKKLGAGGMGVIYLADQVATGRRVALKVLSQSIGSDKERERFLREGRLAATIDHPNSVYVYVYGYGYGYEEMDDVPVIVMEAAGGGTLHDELKRRGTFPVMEAVDAILEVIGGLVAALEKGVLHRDMEPSNCFVTQAGKVMVGDYGLSISKALLAEGEGDLTRSGMIMGTPAFSPPERLRGQKLDHLADIYSTGAALYYSASFFDHVAHSVCHKADAMLPEVCAKVPMELFEQSAMRPLPKELSAIAISM